MAAATPGNTNSGINLVNGPDLNQIGGATANLGNVISANDGAAILLQGESTDGNVIQHNLIGTSADGTTLIGNGGAGVAVIDGADLSEILDNTIAGSAGAGIELDSSTNGTNTTTIKGNTIGTDATGQLNWGSGTSGILIGGGVQSTTIGGDSSDEHNVIAHSGTASDTVNAGILITSTNTTADIRGNSLYAIRVRVLIYWQAVSQTDLTSTTVAILTPVATTFRTGRYSSLQLSATAVPSAIPSILQPSQQTLIPSAFSRALIAMTVK